MKKFFLQILFLAFLPLFFVSCKQEKKPSAIAVSYLTGNPEENNYIKWLKSVDPDMKYFVMNNMPMDSVEIVFDQCSALLLTGGEDVYPGRYGQAEDTIICGKINFYRDSLEFLLIDLAMDRETPIMGVCRGQQILNVAFGGSLIVDIPSRFHSLVYHRCDDWQNCFHYVNVINNSLLYEISGVEGGQVTSNHHQAVKRLADAFRVMATSNDGLIESIGWKDPADKPWLMAVQWHPERMDSTNMLSKPLLEKFLNEAQFYHEK